MKLENGYALTHHEDEDGAEWAERMKIDVDHNCKPITEDK